MALGTTNRRYPDGPLRCHHLGRWQEKRRGTAVTISRILVLRSPQLRLGAGTSAASAHSNREATVSHALSTPTVAIVPQNAESS
jgi:hypothetical protein